MQSTECNQINVLKWIHAYKSMQMYVDASEWKHAYLTDYIGWQEMTGKLCNMENKSNRYCDRLNNNSSNLKCKPNMIYIITPELN